MNSVHYLRTFLNIFFQVSAHSGHWVNVTYWRNTFVSVHYFIWGFQGGAVVKNPLANAGDSRDTGSVPGLGRSLEKEVAIHSSILAWIIPWTKEPAGLQSTGSQRIGHNWRTEHAHMYCFISFYWSIVALQCCDSAIQWSESAICTLMLLLLFSH